MSGKQPWHEPHEHTTPANDTSRSGENLVTLTSLQRFSLAVASVCLGSSLPLAALAQQNYARVLSATPVYEQVAVPHEECMDYARHTRCKTTTIYEEQLVGYDVLYEYDGQQHAQRMARNPGKRIPIQAATPGHRYGSNDRASANSVTPGEKSYGSVAPGAPVVESIEYRNNDADIPINVEIHPGRPQPRR